MEDSIISEGVISGTIQVPGDGQPIIILVETVTGGYRKIATVISGTSREVDVASGELSALLTVYNDDIPGLLERLDTLAVTLAEQVNTLHQNGFNLDGITGLDFFASTTEGASSIALDSNDYPHIGYHDELHDSLKYATKANITSPSRSLTLDIDPDTLNLKSKGRWVTAYLSAENASVQDVNVSTILLQDALAPERWDYQDDVLMLKFNREDFKDTVQVGESVQVRITGKWEDGTTFEAYDSIRVTNLGK